MNEGTRVALVTGANRGLGLVIARVLARRGYGVVIGGRDRKALDDAAAELSSYAPAVAPIAGDITDQSVRKELIEAAGRFGGLDVLVNNASALGPTPLALLGDTQCEDFERALATNVLGPFRLTKALLGSLAASAREGRGSVVLNISSDAAVNAYGRWGAYGSSKAALAHMTRIWNEEMASQGVKLLALDPGDMDTPMHAVAIPDADRTTLKQPDAAAVEIADAIADLLPAVQATAIRRAS